MSFENTIMTNRDLVGDELGIKYLNGTFYNCFAQECSTKESAEWYGELAAHYSGKIKQRIRDLH
jgi:hypothetical protein